MQFARQLIAFTLQRQLLRLAPQARILHREPDLLTERLEHVRIVTRE